MDINLTLDFKYSYQTIDPIIQMVNSASHCLPLKLLSHVQAGNLIAFEFPND